MISGEPGGWGHTILPGIGVFHLTLATGQKKWIADLKSSTNSDKL